MDLKPTNEKKVNIVGSVGKLEAQFSPGTGQRALGIVVCHPHPNLGGTMANNVVRVVYKTAIQKGYAAIRFNFRGVGDSEGKYDNGHGEQSDVEAACKFLQTSSPYSAKQIIIGYSFGAAIGSAIVEKNEFLLGYAAISYPFTFINEFINQARTKKPKFFLMGDIDDFTPMKVFESEYILMPERKAKQIFEAVDHFWGGNEDLLVDSIFKWIDETFR